MATEALEEALAHRAGRAEDLIEVLQDIQEREGYLSRPSMRAVAERLGVPEIEVYRVARFYKAFALEPRGRHTVTVCMGTACHVRGAPLLLDELAGQLGVQAGQTSDDGLFTVERVNCLGACALGPVVVIDGVYHDHVTPAKLRKVIQSIREKEVGADG
jgi:NADH:ubiquinone oxidoreductase subunit E